ncbi:prepilin-type N-terminal cleavage/methylation domain-containing protein [Actimicrobium sp. GrIS 1.19]|uniref:type IV pilin protein n=1 Tax=Actimicrobium sp. GrIS 1.19 TaxID=3071708 RepID=UPI002DFCC449|nr:prepilin-type N-terminal cleavage/methylation domain-containing protein [Actimicrobium sp. GrIS 1.19]
MYKQFKRSAALGFTLIELLIVVIILAILAAIVIPQFTNTTVDAKESTLDANLGAMRSAIELYKIQHNGLYPGAALSNAGAGCASPGVKGTATAIGAQAFIDQLTAATDAAGNSCTIADTTYKYGPYLRQNIPVEPIGNKGSLAAEIVATATGAAIVPTAATGGWAIDTKSGQIVMNSNATDSKATPYYKH